MDPASILTLPKEHRRTFVWLLVLLFLLALLLDWRLSNLPLADAFLGYVRSIAAAILTSLFLLWVIVSFIPGNKRGDSLVELEPRMITKEFDQLLINPVSLYLKFTLPRSGSSDVESSSSPATAIAEWRGGVCERCA